MTNKNFNNTVDTFLAVWEEQATEYYIQLKEDYITESDKDHEITETSLHSVIDSYTYKYVYSEERIAEILETLDTLSKSDRKYFQRKVNSGMFRIWKEKFSRKEIDLATMNTESMKEILAKDVILKKKKLIAAVEKKAGKVVNAKGLTVGKEGSLNGIVEGETKTVHVQTISAGGYNIQCFHYRLLVK